MIDTAARNLRTVERFLLVPPLSADFAQTPVAVSDISAAGARFRHERSFQTGHKGALRLQVEGRANPILLEAVVVWSQADTCNPGRFVSGVRTWGLPKVVAALIEQLQASKRANRIEELRSSDRFTLDPPIDAKYGDDVVLIEDLSARGARIESSVQPAVGTTQTFQFHVPASELDASVTATVVWAAVKAISGERKTWHAGLQITSKPELMRLAIALLTEQKRALFDTHSLALKLKIIRARARQLAPSYRSIESSGLEAEQYLLVQGVREELRLNPEQAMHWYRRARLIINDPKTRELAPMIVDYPDALAVWEYLDRSIDASIVGRAFEIH